MKQAVVTGGGSGIGAAVAKRLLADGWRVTLMGRSLERLQAQQAALGDVALQVCDVSDEASVAAAFAAVGDVDLLVNNAGQVETAPLHKTSLQLWQRLLNVNLTGTFLCSRAVLPGMLARKDGRIVNVASTAALKGYAYVAAYCAAKHGVLGLTRAMALEVATKGVTVNAVCPGYTETDIVANAVDTIVAKTGRTPEQAKAELAKANPQGRLIQPEDVADTVAWLAASPGVNGQAIAVCGGETM
ncbi:NAD(P)-dependent dehydrogenase (short-subunit alcohol dehydrogenase family) [Pelomonas saccharophila]|uniref:NAD(P)-dependent dehydrogenase (Short-subunit alcohol dehydrogenase family) n=1 Tax=Roseateles saccharophilus TaxID=304 RepID=A0ABU1YU84_ROSSA|nr:SDR family NAD(P)-dependent oxidoreductase [Roseateles saccharophilus]MDR7272425.1 NAD(P)-dependent dehydrogenase (short-subunit alcohol dehydrogenase family) [Roseateles saccharophilus]